MSLTQKSCVSIFMKSEREPSSDADISSYQNDVNHTYDLGGVWQHTHTQTDRQTDTHTHRRVTAIIV